MNKIVAARPTFCVTCTSWEPATPRSRSRATSAAWSGGTAARRA